MKKVQGVESVEVSLEKAVTDIHLASGNTVTLKQIRDIIRSSGFNAHEANITATGRVYLKDDKLEVDLAPARVILRIQPGAGGTTASDARKLAGSGSQQVEIRGVIAQGDELSLTSIKPR